MNNTLTNSLIREVIKKYNQPEELAEWSRIVEEGLAPHEAKYINKYIYSEGLILNIGCGGGREAIALAQKGYQVVGIDLTYPMVWNAQFNAKKKSLKIDFSAMNAFSMGFCNNSFKAVLMLGQVLTFIPFRKNRIKALKEVHRVLAPGGMLILTTHSRNSNIKYQLYFSVFNFIRKLKKMVGLNCLEPGDRFAKTVGKAKSNGKHYLHMYSMEETFEDLSASGFKILSCHSRKEIIEKQEKPEEREKDYYLIYAASKV